MKQRTVKVVLKTTEKESEIILKTRKSNLDLKNIYSCLCGRSLQSITITEVK